MKTSLQTKLGTQLALTPQLRQAIRLLQLSALELDAELAIAVESNPLLEHADDRMSSDERMPTDETSSNESGDSPDDGDGDTSADEGFDEAIAFESTGRADGDDDDRESPATLTEDLHGHLLWQLRMEMHEERDMVIGEILIDALDEDGYLREPLEALLAQIPPVLRAKPGDVLAVLRRVQQFEPVGCGARDLGECLRLQLDTLDEGTPGIALARELAAQHLDALARQSPDRLAASLGIDSALLIEATELLRSLDPKPGQRFSAVRTDYVSPDALALRRRGQWVAVLAPGARPALAINRHYERMIGKCGRDDDSYLRGQLQEARWLLKALETRASTVLRVAEILVAEQRGFLEHGPEALRPLTLREVAEKLGMHESTISRATTHKYLRTPRGTFEFKYFFGSGIATDHGGGAAATAIQARIRKLVAAEDPQKPLSDQALADILQAEGIPLARRTVAKYREAIHIPPSSDRQRR